MWLQQMKMFFFFFNVLNDLNLNEPELAFEFLRSQTSWASVGCTRAESHPRWGLRGSFLAHGTSSGRSAGLRSGEFRGQVDTFRSLSCLLGYFWAIFAVMLQTNHHKQTTPPKNKHKTTTNINQTQKLHKHTTSTNKHKTSTNKFKTSTDTKPPQTQNPHKQNTKAHKQIQNHDEWT